MAAFNFPNSPSNGDTYTANGVTFTWNGTIWQRTSASTGAQGAQGAQGHQGHQGNAGAQGAQGTAGSNASISSNADNRVITGGSGTNLNGEANLTFDGNLLKLQCDSGEFRVEAANGVDAFSVDSDNGNTVIGGSGTLTIPDTIVHAGDTNTKIRFPDVDTFTVETNNTERFRIGSNGYIGVGDFSSKSRTDPLNVDSGIGTCNIGGNYIHLSRYSGGGTNYITAPQNNANIYISADDHIVFGVDHSSSIYSHNTEALRIDSSGRLIIGDTANRLVWGINPHLQVNGTEWDDTCIALHNFGNNTRRPSLLFTKGRSGTLGNFGTAVNAGEGLGIIGWSAHDTTDAENLACYIQGVSESAPTANNQYGAITFSTVNGGVSAYERLRIAANGNIGIKLDDPQEPLNVKGTISTGRNVAREKGTIIDISSDYSAGRGAANVINGSKSYEDFNQNDWITANGARVNANFTLDLGAQYTCDRLVIYNQNEYSNNVREVKRFTFEGSNDKSSWTTLLDTECGASYAHEPNPGFSFRLPSNYIDDNEGVTYRYWRFTMKDFHGSTTLGGIMELELYEHAVGEATDDETTSEVTSHAVIASDIYAQNIYHDSPAFFACRTSSFSISNQTNTVIGLVDNQGPGFDTHGYWDNSNYRYNPKIPGYYQINLCCSVSYGALQAGQIYIYKNGSPYAISQLYLNSGDNYDDIALTVSTLVHLDGQSDYIDARAWRNGGNGGLGSGFSDQQISGYLVRHAGYRRHGDGVA